MSETLEKCHTCEVLKKNVFDGLCEDCEPLWLDQAGKISKSVPEHTSITEVMKEAANRATKGNNKK